MSFRVGIIGCGGIASAHADAYVESGATVVAVTDPVPESAAALAARVGGADVYRDYVDLIDRAAPDVVSVCSPPVVHEDAAVYALGRGIHVLCEKPMSFDIPSAYRMREAARASSALLMPAFRHRFLPANIALREIVTSGRIGDPVIFNNVFGGPAFGMKDRWFTRRAVAGGGTLMDTSSHSVDLFRFLIGEIIDQSAVMHRHFEGTDVEDAGVLCVKAANGALGSIESSFVLAEGFAYIDIVGTKGRAFYDYMDGGRVRYRLSGEAEWTDVPVAISNGFTEEVLHLLGAARGEHPLALTVDDGVRSMEVIQSVYA